MTRVLFHDKDKNKKDNTGERTLANQIKFYRKMKDWSQYHLEKETKIQQNIISLYERDLRLPHPLHLTALCEALGVTKDELYPPFSKKEEKVDKPKVSPF